MLPAKVPSKKTFNSICVTRAWMSLASLHTHHGKCRRQALEPMHECPLFHYIHIHTQHGKCRQVLKSIEQVPSTPTVHIYARLLKDCTHRVALNQGKVVHADVVKKGFESDPIVGSALVNMYSKSSNLEDACKVFDMVPVPDLVLWSSCIVACANHNQAQEGLQLFERMQNEGLRPDELVCVHALKACGGIPNLEDGRRIHIIITKHGLGADQFIGSGLVDMYCKCGSLKDAQKVFDEFVVRDVVFWTALICRYVESFFYVEALELFKKMHEEGVGPNTVTYECILKACSSLEAVDEGDRIFVDIVKLGVHDSRIGIVLVHMYCKCGKLEDAHKVFRTFSPQDAVSWSVLIGGYAEQGHGEEAMSFYQNMRSGGTKPDEIVFVCVLKVCSKIAALRDGEMIYFDIVLEGLEAASCIKCSLLDMYIKCGSLEDARIIFDKLPVRDVVSCSALIAGYALHGYSIKSLELFEDMQLNKVEPNEITFASALKACASLINIEYGKQIHIRIMIQGLDNDLFIGSTLIDMYASGGKVDEAYSVFRKLPLDGDVVLWNTIIGVYVEHDQNEKALQLFGQMCRQGVGSNHVTCLWIIRACSGIEQGRLMHSLAVKHGADRHVEVLNTLIGMHGKMGNLEDAEIIFKSLAKRTIASYNAKFAGYALYGRGEEALRLYGRMNEECIQPDQATFVLLMKSCAVIAGLYDRRLIHTAIAEHAVDCESFVGSTVMDLYAKGGSLKDAVKVLSGLHLRDIVTWNTIIAAYADHGCHEDALQCFMTMQQEGIRPDNGTFLSLLHACSHAGIVPLSYHYFHAMQDHWIIPNTQHFVCMIDALGRMGLIDEADVLTQKMPIEPTAVVWTSLLGACLKHGILE